MSLARAWPRTDQSGVKRTNNEATKPPQSSKSAEKKKGLLVWPQRVVFSPRASSSFERLSSWSTDDAILPRTFRRHDDQPGTKRNTQDKLHGFSRTLISQELIAKNSRTFPGNLPKMSNLTRTPSEMCHFLGPFLNSMHFYSLERLPIRAFIRAFSKCTGREDLSLFYEVI